ncbi:unnamed protein product [Cyprideis torosa]|uniref:Uncharacterized protein n=1 Tax=Cyprideis torosa TaxID=163714 RepID=A0A7R8W305_9CRUS|nr:unnamed protein product [Cyprideis torosa]CAG0882397.1 unnamed protein product [Cyprideis torosa]
MAEASVPQPSNPLGDVEETQTLASLFAEGYRLYLLLESGKLATSDPEYQKKLSRGIQVLEDATKLVSSLGLFSVNEVVKEIPASNLKFLLLPMFLGWLTQNRPSNGPEERGELLYASEVYFKDFLQRCRDYEMVEAKDEEKEDKESRLPVDRREMKIRRYRARRSLEERLAEIRQRSKQRGTTDEDDADEGDLRELYETLLKRFIHVAEDELDSIDQERPLVEHMKRLKESGDGGGGGKTGESRRNRKPIQTVIICRNEEQKKVFGLGYPSRPTYTVEEFYEMRARDGAWQREGVMPSNVPTQEPASEDGDDDAERQRLQAMDEFKDNHRRGEGNRYNLVKVQPSWGNMPEPTPKKENLWASILEEVERKEQVRLPNCKRVLVLGDTESGKTTLIAKLQGNEDPKKGSGLEYTYINVRDDYRDDQTHLSVWIQDGDPAHSHLIRFALSADSFEHTLVLLTVSMSDPWLILDSLHRWASLLQDKIDDLKLPPDVWRGLQQKVVGRWKSYREPGDELDPALKTIAASSAEGERGMGGGSVDAVDDEPLPVGTLARNLGLDLIVVVTKTDAMLNLERSRDYKEEHWDFIQMHIREFCLQYGAALCYTSVKEDKNCDLLYKYLVHRIYGLQFRTPALVVEKDAVFIPSGWDSEKKIQILHENIHSFRPDEDFNDVIARPHPSTRKSALGPRNDPEVIVEDEQDFRARLLAAGQKGTSVAPAVQKTGERRTPQNTPKKMESVGKAPGSGPSADSEKVLSQFFNSLLSRKSGGSGQRSMTSLSSKGGSDESSVRSLDPSVELERLAQSVGKASMGGGGADNSGPSSGGPKSSTDC